ncbi:uroporphyrinogen decarboxylase family protein [Candidatus Formimonas warabiya]|uniref:Uroporphyrinogen decarboxylase n=1 Tax=Formimonas warabiya TaxID=1761012 RepID=A0A3G1KRF2_FORW1|nr:uroporphyrinogen decarboxylase family protein [Candidatus Formimonas warabiya]ATW25044.1 uroporphyrinogen decarboxylase [Candidatus Formimonas warabiya]
MEDKEKIYQEKLNRYITAMELGKPDKVPIRLFLSEFQAKYAGYTLQEVYYQLDKNYASVNKVLEDFDLDAQVTAPSLWWASLHDATGAKYLKFAGKELEENKQFQFLEDQYMKAEDYDEFIANPTQWILNTFLPRLHQEFAVPGSFEANLALIKGAFAFATMLGQNAQAGSVWVKEYATPPAIGGMSKAPFDTLGDTLRGLHGIMMDMHKCPEKLLAALDVLVAHNVYYGMATAAGDTQFPLFMPLHRGSFPFLNPKQWDTFYWPTLKKVIETLWSYGKRTLFYAEGNWTPYLERFAELPEKSIVFHIDMTDMYQAKKILGGKFCLSGNVPNTLLAYGKPSEVRDYCKKLIDELAGDGGFIMDAGGVIQWDAKEENIRALIETTREYGVY